MLYPELHLRADEWIRTTNSEGLSFGPIPFVRRRKKRDRLESNQHPLVNSQPLRHRSFDLKCGVVSHRASLVVVTRERARDDWRRGRVETDNIQHASVVWISDAESIRRHSDDDQFGRNAPCVSVSPQSLRRVARCPPRSRCRCRSRTCRHRRGWPAPRSSAVRSRSPRTAVPRSPTPHHLAVAAARY